MPQPSSITATSHEFAEFARPSRRLDLPGEGTYREMLTVRSYEAGPGDVVRPSTLMRYMEYMATRASSALGLGHSWYEERGEAFVMARMRLHIARPARMEQELECATWVAAYRRALATRDYAIWHAETGQPVARASARWAYIDVAAGRPRRVPEDLVTRSGTHGHELGVNPRLEKWMQRGSPEAEDLPTTVRDFVARTYEADTRTHINNCVYVDWLEAAWQDAMRQQGLPADEYRARELHIDYTQQVWPGTRLQVTTRLAQAHPRVAVAYQTITTESGATVVRASTAYARLLACRADTRNPGALPKPGETAEAGEP